MTEPRDPATSGETPLELLKVAQPEFCSMKCPSVLKGPDSARHTPQCLAMQAAIVGAQAQPDHPSAEKPWWCETCDSWRFTAPCGRDECPRPSDAPQSSAGETPAPDSAGLLHNRIGPRTDERQEPPTLSERRIHPDDVLTERERQIFERGRQSGLLQAKANCALDADAKEKMQRVIHQAQLWFIGKCEIPTNALVSDLKYQVSTLADALDAAARWERAFDQLEAMRKVLLEKLDAAAQREATLREALAAIASPGTTADYGWWTETARKALSSTGPNPPNMECTDDWHVFERPAAKGRCRCGRWLIAVIETASSTGPNTERKE